jgi:hypothetical protein
MITVLLDMFTLLMQTISVLALVYGALVAFVFAFGKDAAGPRSALLQRRAAELTGLKGISSARLSGATPGGSSSGASSNDTPAIERAGDLV